MFPSPQQRPFMCRSTITAFLIQLFQLSLGLKLQLQLNLVLFHELANNILPKNHMCLLTVTFKIYIHNEYMYSKLCICKDFMLNIH